MDYDYKFGNNYYKYDGKKGIRSTVYNILAPEQSQDIQPEMEYVMKPLPIFDNYNYTGCNKLKDKVIVYLNEDKDANDTKKYIDSMGKVGLQLLIYLA